MSISASAVKELRERTGVGMVKCKEALEKAGGDLEEAINVLRKAGLASAAKKEGREAKEGVIGFFDGAEATSFVEVNCETDFVAQNEKFSAFVADLTKTAAAKGVQNAEALGALQDSADPSLTIDQARSLIVQSLGENIKIGRVHTVKKAPGTSIGIYSHMGGKIVTAVEIEGSEKAADLAKEIAMHTAADAPEYLKPEDVPANIKAREEDIARSQAQNKPANIIDKIVEGKLKAYYDQVCLICQKFVKDNSITIAQLLEQEGKKRGEKLSIRSFIRWRIGESS